MKKNTFHVLALSLAMGLSAPLLAQAQSPEAAAPTSDRTEAVKAERGGKSSHHRHRHGMHKKGGPGMMDPLLGLQRLAPSLNLTAEQKALFDQAEARQKQAHDTVSAHFKAGRDARAQDLKADVIDLRALSERRQADARLMREQHEQVRQAWLAAYDALNAEQKKTVSDALKKRAEKMQRRAPKLPDAR